MRLGRTSELVCAGMIALGGTFYVLTTPTRAHTEWASSSQMIQDQFLAEGDVRPLSAPAARVALSALSLESDMVGGNTFAAMTTTQVTEIDLGNAGRLQVALIDDDSSDIAFEMFSPYGDERSPIVLDAEIERDPVVAVNYERSFDSLGDAEHLDISITPRAAVSVSDEGTAAGAGAEVRVGRHLGPTLSDEPRWYMFAGADRRALLFNPTEGADFERAMAFTRREVVGDAQAGIAVRFGESADISLAYVRREYQHSAGTEAFDETEQFGAVTVNWRW